MSETTGVKLTREERKKAYDRAWAQNNRERKTASNKAYYEKNKEKKNATRKVWAAKNKEKLAAQAKAWRQANRKLLCAFSKAWKEANPVKVRADKAKRRAAKLQRTVSWSNKKLIEGLYEQARKLSEATGELYHVDHIVPLQGELVSGLHVETNLQVLLAQDNLSKSNKFQPEKHNEAH